MPRVHQRLLWSALLAAGNVFVASTMASAGICEHCTEEKRPRYIPVCDPCYGFHRTGWRPWNPAELHWHPNESHWVGMETGAIAEPLQHAPPAPAPVTPNWPPQPVAPQHRMPELPRNIPPLPSNPAEFAPAPHAIPTSDLENENRPMIDGIPVLFVGHSTLKPPKTSPQAPIPQQLPTVISAPPNPYGDYRQTQPSR